MTALAVTDHRVGYGLLDVYLACKQNGIKPILGCELNENFFREIKSFRDRKERKIKSYHLPIMALNFEGYQNLCRILSDAADAGIYVGPGGHFEEANVRLIRENGWGKSIIALTGCLGSRLAAIWREDQTGDGRMEAAMAWLRELQETFTEVYIELQFHSNEEQQQFNLFLLELHKKTDIPMVATRDYHYVNEEDGKIHDVYITCGNNSWRDAYDSHDYFFCAPDVMYDWIGQHDDFSQKCRELGIDPEQALLNTQEIADRVNIEIPTGKSLMPGFPVPEGHTEATYLRKLCTQLLLAYAAKRNVVGRPIDVGYYIERLEWELRVICDRGNAGYMLILWDILKWCKENGIITGPGRGSAAGSLVAYMLSITQLDPLEYDLLFQRFLSPDRADEPDIDTDIADIQRGKVIRYVADRYGEARVAQIGTYGTLAVKQATQDLGKALGLFQEQVVALTKPLPAKWPDQTSMDFQKLKEIVKDDPDHSIIGDLDPEDIKHLRELAEMYWVGVKSVEGLEEAISRVEGARKSIGIHAGGVAICPIDIASLVPLTNVPDAAVVHVTQYDMSGLSKLGILKMDLLGLRTLSVIRKCLDLITETEGKDIDLTEISLEIPEVFQIFARGRTHGVFQANGRACQQIAMKMKPNSFNEVIDLLALARPGPMEAEVEAGVTMVDQYIINKIKLANDEPIDIPHPDLTNTLMPTKGIWCYQEQLMVGSGILAGFTPGAQDTLRSATAKKKQELIRALYYVFIYGSAAAVSKLEAHIEELKKTLDPGKIDLWNKALKEVKGMGATVPGGLAKGYTLELLNNIYDAWIKFSGYSFNKSHSAAYALISYWTAYLKTFYPAQYMCALLTSEASKPEKTAANLSEVRRLGIPVLPPDVTRSLKDFSPVRLEDSRMAILYGLLGIKGVGDKAVNEIISKRGGSTQRTLDEIVQEQMDEVVAALTGSEPETAEAEEEQVVEGKPYTSLEDFFGRVNARVLNRGVIATLIKAGAFDVFNPNRFEVWEWYHFTWRKDSPKEREKFDRFTVEDWEPEHAWGWEKELMGQFISGHPLQDLPTVVWEQVPHNYNVEIGGLLAPNGLKVFNDKRSRPMAVGRIETVSGLVLSFTIFADVWEKVEPLFAAGAAMVLKGKKDYRRDSLVVSSASKGVKRKAKKAKPITAAACAAPVIVSDPIQDILNGGTL